MTEQRPHAPRPEAPTGDGPGRCPACGAPHQPGDRFCGTCGAPLQAPEPPPVEPAPAPEPPAPERPVATEATPAPRPPRRALRRLLVVFVLFALGAGSYLGLRILADELAPTYVYGLAFSADGSRLASTGPDRSLRLWDTASGQPAGDLELPYGHHAIAFTPDGGRLAVSTGDGPIRLFRLPDLTPAGELAGHAHDVQALCFDADGTTLYSVDTHFGFAVWDSGQATRLGGLDPRPESVLQQAAFSADCSLLAYGSGPPDNDYRVVRRINLEPVLHLAPEYSEQPGQFALGLKGSLFFGIRYGHITLWRVSSGEVARSLDFEEVYPTALAISGDNRFFAVGSGDGAIHLYDASKGTPLRTLRHAGALAAFLMDLFPGG